MAQEPEETSTSTEEEARNNYAYRALKTCQQLGGKTMLVIGGESITGREMHRRVSAAVYQLRACGVLPRDRVLVTMTPSVDFFALLIATFYVGGCLVILDPAMGLERANYCIKTAAPSAWVITKGSWFKYLKYLMPALRSIAIHLEVGRLAETTSTSSTSSTTSSSSSSPSSPSSPDEGGDVVESSGGHQDPLVEVGECVPVENALVTFTTGSTGLPKLMLRKHKFLLNQSHSVSYSFEKVMAKEVGVAERDGIYCTNLALFALHFMTVGATCLVFPSITKAQPARVIDAMKKYGVSFLGGSPAFVNKIADYAMKNKIELSLKGISVGGAPVYRGMLRTMTAAVLEKKAMVLYGSTEVEPISVIFAEEKLKLEAGKPDGLCVGRPVFENSTRVIKILSEPLSEPVDISTLVLPPGEVGEIIVSGWHVNTNQVEEKRLVRDLSGKIWLRVEDAGYMDEEGRIWLVGRVKWRVERNGKTFWSTVVEQKVLDRCSMLTFAAYLPRNGETWLFLEAPQGLPPNEESALKQFLLAETIPVDHLVVKSNIPKDRRHQSKPDTAVIFAPSAFSRYSKIVGYLLRSNPLFTLLLILIQLFLIIAILFLLVLPW